MTGTYYGYLSRVSSHCIHFLELDEARASLENLRVVSEIATYSIDGATILKDHDLFSALAVELQFPDWFGMNWNALEDCVRDMDGQDAPGYVFAIWNSIRLWHNAPRTAGNLIHAWQWSVEYTWLLKDKPFHLVFVW
jgi:hypothetical protein